MKSFASVSQILGIFKRLSLSLFVLVMPFLMAQPALAATATPNFSAQQTYNTNAAIGMGNTATNGLAGNYGKNVKIADLEYSWSTTHEDLPLNRAADTLWAVGTPYNPLASGDTAHGTAVSGIIGAARNGYGINGIASNAEFHMVNTYSYEYGWDVARAVNLASSKMSAGDVILIEQQTVYSDGTRLPMEWNSNVYDAIKAATNKGIIVIEPSGDGAANLDDPKYGSAFPMGKADSGAIMVGAGTACDGTANHARYSVSGYGKRVDVMGYGECVFTTGGGNYYGSGDTAYMFNFNGTSSAAALVAAQAAVLSSAYKTMYKAPASPALIRFAMAYTGTPQYTATDAGKVGPLVNLQAALKALDNQAPTTPTGAKVYFNSYNQPVFTWTAATDNTGVNAYRVYRNGTLLATLSGTTVKYVDKKFSSKTTYSYQVQAVDGVGNTSAKTAKVSITTK